MSQLWANLGTGGTALDARNGSGTGVDSNDAKLLEHDGTNYVYLPGVTGNYMSVPDEAALDITGDIDIRVRVAMDDWTPAANNRLVSKWSATNQFSYSLYIATDGKAVLQWSTDGTFNTGFFLSAISTVATGISDGAAKWVRATLDVDNGGQYQIIFYTSDDGATWTQLGAAVNGTTGPTSIFASTSVLEIGSGGFGTNNPLAAKVYRAIVRDGIGGTTVLDVDTSVITSGAATSFTATTGQTVTISRSTSGRKSVAVVNDVWLLGTANYLEIADNALLDFGASDSFTVMAVVRQWGTPASNRIYVGKLVNGPTDYDGWELRSDATNLRGAIKVLEVGSGDEAAAVGPSTYTAGSLQTLAGVGNRTTNRLQLFQNGTGGTDVNMASVGDVSTSVPLRIGASSSGTIQYQDFECYAVAVFRRALTAGEISALSTYYATRFP